MLNRTVRNNIALLKRFFKRNPEIAKQHDKEHKAFWTTLNSLKHLKDGVRIALEKVAGNLGFEDNTEINRRRFTKEQGGSI